MYKHYIRTDENNVIIYAFSDAFYTPIEGDIEVTESNKGDIYEGIGSALDCRHFNPNLIDINRKYIWKYYNDIITVRSEEERYPISDLKVDVIRRIKSSANAILSNTDWKVIRHRDQVAASQSTSISDNDYQSLLADRNGIRTQSNSFEDAVNALSDRNDVSAYTWEFEDIPQ